MILKAFSEYLHSYTNDIPSHIILCRWLKDILNKIPQTNVERVIHYELTLIQSEEGIFAILGSSMSGQKLLENLYKYTQSYDNQTFSRWIHELKPNDFNQE